MGDCINCDKPYELGTEYNWIRKGECKVIRIWQPKK